MSKEQKKPSDQEYLEYGGGQSRVMWKKLDDGWKCPSCERTKREVMRWTGRGGLENRWLGEVYKHHDHSGCKRFDKTVVCELCNSADGNVKSKFSLPDNFSFSPEEIGSFVIATPNGKHNINFEKAKNIYDSLQ